MFEWLWRKSAPERQPYVPVWLQGDGETGGYARGIEGMRLLDRVSGQVVLRRSGTWETGIVRAQEYQVGGTTVVRARQPAIADPAGGSTIDIQGRAAIASILAMLRTHGLTA